MIMDKRLQRPMENPIDLFPGPTAGVLRSPSEGGSGVTTRGSCPTIGHHEPHSLVTNTICVKGGTHPEDRGRPGSLVLIIDALGVLRGGRHGEPGFLEQLYGLLHPCRRQAA